MCGYHIRYGYLELNVELCDKVITKRGVLVKDPFGQLSSAPGVLGMNVIKTCYTELFALDGSALFDLPSVSQAPSQLQTALQQCHQDQADAPPDRSSRVKIKSERVFRVHGGTIKLVATCSQHYSGRDVLFEPLSTGLLAGLLVSPALVQLSGGTAYIPMSKPAHRGHRRPGAGFSHNVFPDGYQLQTDQSQVRSLLQKHIDVFSAHEGDLGCTSLISHDIPLLDETPVKT